MRVAVIGQGAIGRALVKALGALPEVTLLRVDRTRSPLRGDEPGVDVAVVCVKTPGTLWAADVAARLLKPGGVVLTVQNGLGNVEELGRAAGVSRATGGSLTLGAYIDANGELQVSGTPRLVVAPPADPAAARALEGLLVLLERLGWEIVRVVSVMSALWRKVVVNAAINPVTAILGLENGALPRHAPGALVADALAAEAARVATAVGTPMTGAEARGAWRETSERTAANYSSMLVDVRGGRETEIDAICGAIAREGERRGVPAPLNAAMSQLIRALAPPL